MGAALATVVTGVPVAGADDGTREAASVPVPDAARLEGLTFDGLDRSDRERQAYFVQFAGQGAADLARSTASPRAVRDRRAAVEREASSALDAARAVDASATRLFVVANALPGMGVTTDLAGLRALTSRSDVVQVSRIIPKTAHNAGTAALVRAINTWSSPGSTGAGVRVGVIDTGLDYTHAHFGGVGTPVAYDAAHATATDADWWNDLPTLAQAKVIGGYDLVGDNYNGADQFVPSPDPNPIDCGEHGTHVAGTAAGYGVNADGSTFTGDYPAVSADDLMDMRVGPGMAPEASLYALKVFGCDGSTLVVIEAMDRALDPNQDGNFSDKLDIINMSLGSDYGFVDDPEADVVAELADHGVLSVISMGNNGDLTDTGGSPGSAVSSLAVASTVDSYQLRDGLTVNAPAGVAGTVAGQMSVAYDWANETPVTGAVAAIPGANADGCDGLSSADEALVTGKVAWLVWDDSDETRRCGSVARSSNVKAAGAIGAIFTSDLDVFNGGITGDADIPVLQLPRSVVTELEPAVTAGTLDVTFDGALQATVHDVDAGITDTISSFTSRGPHGSIGVVKPDVAAPGDTIASAGMGSGTGPLAMSGTSMAAPLTTGVAALVKAQHPSWTPLMVKAAVMNTAGHDLWTGPNRTGRRYAPARVGAGRVDALRATRTKVLAYVSRPADAVSASFGVVPVKVTQRVLTRTRTLTVRNTGSRAVTTRLKYQSINPAAGVTYSVTPSRLRVGARSTGTARVTMTVRPTRLRHTIDATMATKQLGAFRHFVSDSSGRVLVTPTGQEALRVPVYGAAKPVSTTTAAVAGGRIRISGPGIDQGSGKTSYRSLLSVMDLGRTSGVLPGCAAGELPVGCTSLRSEKAGDIKAVGAGATSDWLWFGLATHGDWANIGHVLTPYVDYDIDGDSVPDLETYVTSYGPTDVLVAVTVELVSGNFDTLDVEYVNALPASTDSNVFDSNVVLLPVWRDTVGLSPQSPAVSTPITYTVGVWNGYVGAPVEEVTASFDVGTPAVRTAAMLYQDKGRTAVTYRAPARTKALVFHLHGAKGARSQVLTLPAHR